MGSERWDALWGCPASAGSEPWIHRSKVKIANVLHLTVSMHLVGRKLLV